METYLTKKQIADHINDLFQIAELPYVNKDERDKPLCNIMVFNSLDHVDMVLKMEKYFGVTITDDASARISTFNDMVNTVFDLKSPVQML